MLAPRFRLATLDRGLCDREPLPRDSHLSTRRRTFPPASNFQLRFLSRWAPSGRKPDPTFSVGKTRGALSPPQQPISALQPPVSNSGFGSPVDSPGVQRPDLQPLEPPVTGRRSWAAGRPSPYARFSMLAPTSWLSTLELSTFDCQLPMASQLLTVWRLFFSLSPLQSALTQKCGCKSFAIRSYKSLDLKSPGMTLLQKIPGVGGVCLLQTQDLSRIFHCQAGPVVRGRGKYLS